MYWYHHYYVYILVPLIGYTRGLLRSRAPIVVICLPLRILFRIHFRVIHFHVHTCVSIILTHARARARKYILYCILYIV